MILSTETGNLLSAYSPEQTVDILSRAGFDAIDFSFCISEKYYSDQISDKYFSELKKYAEDKGMFYNQAHAPYGSSSGDEEWTKKRFEEIVCSVKRAALLGIKNIIVHPCQHLEYAKVENRERLFEINMDFYSRLKPYCEEYGICVALENMWQYTPVRHIPRGRRILPSTCASKEEFIRYLDALDSEWFVACLDIGHATLVSEDVGEFIHALGRDRLKALHVHDVDNCEDLHTLPYNGTVDWEKVTKALADIDYAGDFTLEADYFYVDKPKELYESYIKTMANTGRYLIEKIENYKK